MKIIDVTCAIIVNADQQVLVTQRSAAMKLPLKMEFPGGKVEPGETPSACLVREIKEELNLDIFTLFEMPSNTHSYPDITINLIPFICGICGGNIELREHASFMWTDAADLLALDWAEADVPIVKNYLCSVKGQLL
ncbi:(deoxy)nucleoside triphosphate pyrophosphohydrolase [Pedobacter metabolipauper]|uniref:8-oxo-dGTP diphosphatase n=1 Tax=Pedobacter metabolipauper TaxID=425513 RepID=A0A4R6SZD0_9SPHI|nr:(deoxy)nucleoside triphosphate pyrophosphohydrolase [Pedobacter metabolipauper]TDQ11395.1 8-oxo-dGTP diphosphatase [Pedobacter metabolipauper]